LVDNGRLSASVSRPIWGCFWSCEVLQMISDEGELAVQIVLREPEGVDAVVGELAQEQGPRDAGKPCRRARR
jgi:hypothetical protein